MDHYGKPYSEMHKIVHFYQNDVYGLSFILGVHLCRLLKKKSPSLLWAVGMQLSISQHVLLTVPQTKINPERSQSSTQLCRTAAEWGGELK